MNRWRLAVLLGAMALSSACSDSTETPASNADGSATGNTESPSAPGPSTAAGPRLGYQGEGTIWTLGSDGSRLDVGSQVDGDKQHPDWSPDGARLVFDVNFLAIWVVDADGSDPERLFMCEDPCAAVQDAAWSPDGTEVIFTHVLGDGVHTTSAQLLALDVSTGAQRVVFEDTSQDVWLFEPRWSREGDRVVVEADRFASNLLSESQVLSTELRVVDVEDGNAVSPPGARGVNWDDWSPADDLLTYTKGGNLFTMRPDGTDRRKLTSFLSENESAIQPTFTPDGAGIVFTKVTGRIDSGSETTSAAILDLVSGEISIVPGSSGATHPRLQPSN